MEEKKLISDEDQDALLRYAIDRAIRKGVPTEALEGSQDPMDVAKRVAQWEKLKLLEECDRNRIKAGLKPLRNKVMHHMSDADEK